MNKKKQKQSQKKLSPIRTIQKKIGIVLVSKCLGSTWQVADV